MANLHLRGVSQSNGHSPEVIWICCKDWVLNCVQWYSHLAHIFLVCHSNTRSRGSICHAASLQHDHKGWHGNRWITALIHQLCNKAPANIRKKDRRRQASSREWSICCPSKHIWMSVMPLPYLGSILRMLGGLFQTAMSTRHFHLTSFIHCGSDFLGITCGILFSTYWRSWVCHSSHNFDEQLVLLQLLFFLHKLI